MDPVLTTILLTGGKTVKKILSTRAYEFLCENENGRKFLEAYVELFTSMGFKFIKDNLIEDSKTEENKRFLTFQNILQQLIHEAITDSSVPEEKREWINMELTETLNRIKIPPEKWLGDGLDEYLCDEYYKLSAISENEMMNTILKKFATGYKETFWKVSSNNPNALLIIDKKFSEHDKILTRHEARIQILEEQTSRSFQKIQNSEHIEGYYNSLVKQLEKTEDLILGKKSLKDTYIAPRIKYGGDMKEEIYKWFRTTEYGGDMKEEIYKWFRTTEYGVLLLYGHPGHGKTSFCRKFVYDYAVNNDHRSEDAEILQFPLNPVYSNIVENNKINLIKCINDGSDDGETLFSWNECSGKLIFLDGFDELYNMMTTKTTIKSYTNFSNLVERISIKYKIHFVITSRINAITESEREQENAYEFDGLSLEDQSKWCSVHNPEYWNNYLHKIYESKNSNTVNNELKVLLEIPCIFRMVVENSYVMETAVGNRAALFTDLFKKTIERSKKPYDDEKQFKPEKLNENYQQMAYYFNVLNSPLYTTI